MYTVLISVLATLLVVGLLMLFYLLLQGRAGGAAGGSGTGYGPYRRLTLLSDKGGMAKIYHGLNSQTQRECVLKVLRRELLDDQGIVRKFRRESEILKQLKAADPDLPVPLVYGSGSVSTGKTVLPLIELQYIPGHTHLGDYLKQRGRLDSPEAAGVLAQICCALRVAHRLGIVHRDLKPGNVLLANGKPDAVVVIDFGVARRLDAKSVTVGGLGTASYMAPEQVDLSAPITPATDIYALGMLWYELLTGRKLFSDDNPLVVMRRIQEGNAGDLAKRDVPESVRELLAGMLARDPSDRPSAEDVYGWLDRETAFGRGMRV